MPASPKFTLAVAAICAVTAHTIADDGWRAGGREPVATDSSGTSAHLQPSPLIIPRRQAVYPVAVTGVAPVNVSVTVAPIPPHNGWKSNNGANKTRTSYWRRADASPVSRGFASFDSGFREKPAESAGKIHRSARDTTAPTTHSGPGAGTSTYELTAASTDTPSLRSSDVFKGLTSYDSKPPQKPAQSAGKSSTSARDTSTVAVRSGAVAGTSTYELTAASTDAPRLRSSDVLKGLTSYESKPPQEPAQSSGESHTSARNTSAIVVRSGAVAGTSTYELTAASTDAPSLRSPDVFKGLTSYDSGRPGGSAEASAEIRTADFNSAGLVTYSCSEAGIATYRLTAASTDGPRPVLLVGHSTLPADQNSSSDIEPTATDDEGISADKAADSGLIASELIPVKPNAHASQSHYLEQLHSLVCEDEQVAGSYLTDLNQLIARDSKWLLAKDELIDLNPGAAEPTLMSGDYLSDLQRLVEGLPIRPRQTNLVSESQYSQSPYGPTLVQSQSGRKYFRIPPPSEAECRDPEPSRHAPVDALFTPVHQVQVYGPSTAPPIVTRRANSDELELPPDFACKWAGEDAPVYYYAQGYGVCRAPRNTHRFYNNPLYFEDPNLERCGISRGCLTTASSAVDFAWQTVLMPYRATVQHPSDCVAALPDCPTCYNFGSDAYVSKWSWKAAAVQAAAVTGAFYAIP